MHKILNYELVEKIYASDRTVIHRARGKSYQKPVILKLPHHPYPNFNELTRYRSAYTLIKNFNFPGIVKMLALEQFEQRLILVMEDFGGISLHQFINNQSTSNLNSFSTDINQFFHIALQIVNSLEKLHQNQIIHKDIKPHNIIINPQTKQIQIIDFSSTTKLPKETPEIRNPNTLEGTLTYMSPEQTGRMNRGIDYRSDFYSLGITFYELLTRRLPFQSKDPMELVHFHIARQPKSIIDLNPKIPAALNTIVLKLMAKMPEERYQTTAGLRHDLEKCQSEWENTGKIRLFNLGEKDNNNCLIIPEKLYGRDKEIEILLTAFDRICNSYKPQIELMLVGGFSGIGKSALVNEIHKPILKKRGYFISGKFDQFQRNIPFYAWLNAFQELIKQILSEPEEKLQAIATKLQQVLGEEAQVIIDVIPELELLIGKQPPATELSPTAAENRFNLLLSNFISVFAQAEHPLVIFLDDLQWADLASLKLMKLVMEKMDINYLLLIGAYRDNEVNAGHPFLLTVEEIKEIGAVVNQIILTPLSQSALNNLVADTVNYSPQESLLLTEQIYQKTQGNPFFSNQFIKSLHKEGLIFYNDQQEKWLFNLPEIKILAARGDVIELMAAQIQKLFPSTQEILQLAACISNKFDLKTLSIVYEKRLSETALILWNALSEGLILPEDETYKFYQGENDDNLPEITDLQTPIYYFIHDRVQQAAYSLIPQQKKQETHLKIGRLLLNNTEDNQLEEKIFEIVNQLNYGVELITEAEAREELASLNLKAGIKAKVSTAYKTAISYFNIGINLLTKNSWSTQYQLTLALHEEGAEATYLNGDFKEMEKLVDIVLEKANTLLEKVNIYEIKIQAYIAQSKLQEALTIGLSVLELLDISFPTNPTQSDIQEYLQTTKEKLKGKNISELIDLPLLQDQKKLAAMQILSSIITLTFVGKPELLPLIICAEINLSLKSGISPLFAFSCATYGLLLCGVEQDIDTGYKFGILACELLEKFHSKDQKTRVFQIVYNCIENWKVHIQETFPHVIETYKIGLETGDLEFASYGIHHYCCYSYLAGISLEKLEPEIENYSNSLKQIKQENTYYYNQISHQAVLNLLGHTENSTLLSGNAFNEEKFIPFYENINDRYALFQIYFNKLILSYFLGNFQNSKDYAILAGEYIDGVTGLFYIPVYYLYRSLAQLACYSEAETVERKQILEEVTANQEKMKFWAEHAPTNYSHKYYLITAEKQKILGEKLEAIETYEQAIALATENKYIQEAALANELCAKFYLEWGKSKIAQTYMLEAYYGYINWGAVTKVKDLEKRYPQLLTSVFLSSSENSDSLATSHIPSINRENILDLSTVLKAYQTLSGEVKLENLLSTLIRLIMENAGAQKCALILLREQQLILEAITHVVDTQEYLQNFERPVIPISATQELPQALINYVWRTQKFQVLDDATTEATWVNDPYLKQKQPQSILCTPIIKQGKLIGIIYLENNLTKGAFTSERLELLEMITTQAAISLENALLYDTLEKKVEQRTQELNKKNQCLAQTLEELKQTQTQLIQTEKMSSLGQLVAGIAHEINNPVNFIYGNLDHTQEYAENLLNVIKIYQQYYPESVPEVTDFMEEVDLDFLVEDLPKILNSMKIGANRIKEIVESLRNFSRLDESEIKNVDIHEGIDSTLMILQNNLKAKPHELEIKVVKNYGKLPKIKCYPGELNQAFMNIISNAIDAVQPMRKESSNSLPQITITTEIDTENQVIIRIADNGIGMSEAVQKHIFDPFYTTKPVGQGTGLGLAISYQTIVEHHEGELECISALGKGTEFLIKIPILLSGGVGF
ncbi:MAG: AAA family ATPase [Okeania sp. SIO3B5]|uniref:ATP-binding sensor histidine kinase n=1 Tax=Okeania sp. SIO3B5 TaxID=2607811 RepID=UPI001400C476|nr:ATP-binding sensor histidine kinase [Okeania sp. SIO3B5]NEO52306.1 AAA family ATPase [Okeania sp. SIO3B5]